MDKLFEKFFTARMNINKSMFKNQTSHATANKGGIIKALIITVIIGIVAEYLMLVPLNFKAVECYMFIIFLCLLFSGLEMLFDGGFNKLVRYVLFFVGFLVAIVVVGNIISLEIFHAKSYQQQLVVDEEADFYQDNPTISYQTIPVVDKDSATRLGDRKMGEIVDFVSQFDVDESYEQINYDDHPVRVTPLVYNDLIKWFTNHSNGLPAYVMVDMVSQEASVIRLDSGMKYSKSELFGRNIERHLRMNYPTLMFDDPAFEINDEGVPYWIAPVYDYKIGLFGGKDIIGAVLVNAINGDHQYYKVEDVPNWVDRVYPADLVTTQLENWGKYERGYFNAKFSQKGVLQPTIGYNYLALDDDVYYYTGLTSVSSDASNVGFALINLRTKAAKYYNISGAEEYSAMSSAEGKVQNLGYKATFPILINAGGEPTYFLSLKDGANLVKMYAFVSVENYQLVATGSSVAEAERAYYQLLSDNGKIKEEAVEEITIDGKITAIHEAVVDGSTHYYFTIEGSDVIFIADVSLSERLPFASVGDHVTIQCINSESDSTKSEIITNITFD